MLYFLQLQNGCKTVAKRLQLQNGVLQGVLHLHLHLQQNITAYTKQLQNGVLHLQQLIQNIVLQAKLRFATPWVSISCARVLQAKLL